MQFQNATALDSSRLLELFTRHSRPFRHDLLNVYVRYSRGAAFSGSCHYRGSRIYINLGRRLRFPFSLATHVAKARSGRTHWWRESYVLTVRDGHELALFIYLHELFHYLVKAAGRCTRRKEAMCDRFATRVLVDSHGAALRTARGEPVAREAWDFQDLEAFVAAAPRQPTQVLLPFREIPVLIHGLSAG